MMKKIKAVEDLNIDLLEGLSYDFSGLMDHEKIANELKGKNPKAVTVIIENLAYDLWRRKEFARGSKHQIYSRFHELIWEAFRREFYDQEELNAIYAKWLKKYNNNDDLIMEKELEVRYGQQVKKRFHNVEKNMKMRTKTEYDRYYNLPTPLNHVDWRNSYDNIFIWEEKGKKVCARGGSGSSGGRERNSAFIFGLSLINMVCPVPSYLFLYSDHNQLLFLKKFSSLTIPRYDVGSNYFLDLEDEKKICAKTNFLEWNMLGKLKELSVKIGEPDAKEEKFQVER